MQYTSMNTLVFADLSDADASPGSSISSTVQQMSMSFGVAVSSLLAALFLGGERRARPRRAWSPESIGPFSCLG